MASEDTKKPAASPLDDIIASATRAEREVKVCVAGALNARFAALEAELIEAQRQKIGTTSLKDADPTREIAQQLEAVRVEMAQHEHVFTFRALAPKDWSDLLAAHAPRNGKDETFNADTFPVALCARSLVAIDGADAGEESALEAKVGALFDVLNLGQRDELFTAAWEANTGRVSVPFSALGSAVLRSTEPS